MRAATNCGVNPFPAGDFRARGFEFQAPMAQIGQPAAESGAPRGRLLPVLGVTDAAGDLRFTRLFGRLSRNGPIPRSNDPYIVCCTHGWFSAQCFRRLTFAEGATSRLWRFTAKRLGLDTDAVLG
jgi:hypothetical protein